MENLIANAVKAAEDLCISKDWDMRCPSSEPHAQRLVKALEALNERIEWEANRKETGF